MTKRASLDTELFKVTFPPTQRDPLDSVIPPAPPTGQQGQNVVNNPTRQNGANNSTSSNTVYEVKNDGSVEVSNRRKVEKTKKEIVRRAFDVYSNQVISLQRIQLVAVTSGKKKPKIGSMVRLALDRFIASELKKQDI